jgi:hypothetical protein
VLVSQVPTPLQSTAPSSAAVLWSELMSPNHAKVPLQRCSAQEGPPNSIHGITLQLSLRQYMRMPRNIDVSLQRLLYSY